ncbi:MAG: 50S ribosomal protein L9 [Chitinophagales bacterium]|jgi:large subunit ribosomal protein L9|nr:50S ribosomal protein L9 [Bacteroidota bacterium]MBK9507726.1 50S ribosomal protein L9 [Bacteroidota bacterium]MBK9557518.1 50S ribosomal protein L9 [Bacteroidota bacterium]MBL0282244.1 50S ribosomal protein L9 [Bacteroidota bacterium]MBP9880634.1 50S ribosomal protein L9 [Chitinophagales bacterium]
MEVILIKDVDNLGDANELVKVRDGYGRNYLIPRGLAVIANEGNRKMMVERQKGEVARERKLLEKIQEVTAQLQANTIKVGAKVGASDKIFGSITNVQLAEAIKKQIGLVVDRKKIVLPDEVKTLGNFTAHIALDKDHNIPVNFEVIEG